MSSSIIDDFVNEYEVSIDKWRAIANYTKDLFEVSRNIPAIEAIFACRAKDPSSLREKLKKRSTKKNFTTKEDIWNDIHDRAGVRICLYAPTEAQKAAVKRVLDENFPDAFQVPSPGKGPDDENGFNLSPGYQAEHYRVRLGEKHFSALAKRNLPLMLDKRPYEVEIQVIPLFRHAATEAIHRIAYKVNPGSLSLPERVVFDMMYDQVAWLERTFTQIQRIVAWHVNALDTKFADMYDLGTHISKRLSQNAAIKDIETGPVEPLFHLLKATNQDSPRDLELILSNIDFTIFPEGSYCKSRASILIMYKILNDPVSTAEQAPTKDLQWPSQCQVLASAMLWLEELFSPSVDWHKEFRRENMNTEEKAALRWIMVDYSLSLTYPHDLSSPEAVNIDLLWHWFVKHKSPIVQFAFKLARLGIIKDIILEWEKLDTMWYSLNPREHLSLTVR